MAPASRRAVCGIKAAPTGVPRVDGATPEEWKAAYEQAQMAWPNLPLDETAFRHHLETLGCVEPLPPFVVHVYLTCACGQGHEAACRLFDRTYAAIIRNAIKTVCRAGHRVEEILQVLREKLFVGPPPGVLKYSGRTSLEAWLRLVVKRVALDSERAARRRARRDALAMNPSDSVCSAVESDLDRLRYTALLQAGLSGALAGLPSRDFDVLRLHYASDVGIGALGRAFGVHRATVARWIAKGQRQVRQRMCLWLNEASGGLSEDDVRELLAVVDSRMDLDISCWGGVKQVTSAVIDGAPSFSCDTAPRAALAP